MNELKILNLLMCISEPLDTKQLADRAECDRKTVYAAISRLEIAGFHIEVEKGPKPNSCNKYKFAGIYGF